MKPWYREPWPWILMSGPAIVVVAVTTNDGLVADDYYKQGLAINRVIEREARAKALGLSASLQFSPAHDRVRVLLTGAESPAALKLAFVHPTIAGEDQQVRLARVSPGVYEAPMRSPRQVRFHVRLEDERARWRLDGDWKTSEDGARLAPE